MAIGKALSPHKCPHCEKVYSTRGNLYLHLIQTEKIAKAQAKKEMMGAAVEGATTTKRRKKSKCGSRKNQEPVVVETNEANVTQQEVQQRETTAHCVGYIENYLQTRSIETGIPYATLAGDVAGLLRIKSRR